MPAHFDAEVYIGLRRLNDRGVISGEHLDRAVVALTKLPGERRPLLPLLPRVHRLGRAFAPADGFYVALAHALGVALLTCDQPLADAARRLAKIEVVLIRS